MTRKKRGLFREKRQSLDDGSVQQKEERQNAADIKETAEEASSVIEIEDDKKDNKDKTDSV